MNKKMTFPAKEEQLLINGPAGVLEVWVSYPDEVMSHTIAVICHPDPLQEGTMHNKIVTTLHNVFQARGLRTIRFNYRGVGKSEGSFGNAVGEIDDLLAVVAWARTHNPLAPIALAGFSFGGYIALQGAVQIKPVVLITVAPSVTRKDRQDVGEITCPWIVAQGNDDDVMPLLDIQAWLAMRDETLIVLEFPKTGHFFHGKLIDLRERLLATLPAL